MSGEKLATTVLLTSVTVSGTTDGSGTWHEDYDLSALATVPASATHAVLNVYNSSSGGRWAGVRTPGKTNHIKQEQLGRETMTTWFVPINPANGLVDLYAQGPTGVQFRLVGFLTGSWTVLDIDAGLPVIPSTGGAQSDITVDASIPLSATALLMQHMGAWCPMGETTPVGTGSGSNMAIIKLDASNQVRVAISADMPILAYATAGVELVTPWRGSAESVTADGTWRVGSYVNSGAQFVQIHMSGHNGAQGFGTKRNGDDPTGILANSSSFVHTAAVDGSGQYAYNAESVLTGTPYAVIYLTEAAAQHYSIDCDSGSYVLTGQAASLLSGGGLTAEAGSYTLLGSAALRDIEMDAVQGSYALNGQEASLISQALLVAASGSYSIIGQSADLLYSFAASIVRPKGQRRMYGFRLSR